MAVALRETEQCIEFFQQTIVRTVRQWQESEAVHQVDVPLLDRDRLTILNVINRGLEYQPSWPELKELVVDFASYMERRGHWDVWRGVLNASINVARTLCDVDAEITLTALFARLSQRQGRGKDVVSYNRRVVRLAKLHGNQFEEARACSNLGYYYIDAGRWWRAEVLSCHALTLFEALGSEHGRAHTHNHLGVLYLRMKNWLDAKQNLNEACALWETMNDDASLINGYGNLGLLHNELQEPIDAIEVLGEALLRAEKIGDELQIANFWVNLGIAYLTMEQVENAENYILKAQVRYRELKNSAGLVYTSHHLGRIAMHKREWHIAEQFFKNAIDGYIELRNTEGELKVLCELTECAFARNQPSLITIRLNQLDTKIKHLGQYSQSTDVTQKLLTYRSRLSGMQ